MRQLLTITGMFNDEFTGYQDKMSSVSMIVDVENECTCLGKKICSICKLVSTGTLSEIKPTPMKDPQVITKVAHSKSKIAWNVIGTTLGKKHKIAIIPYVEDVRQRQEAFEHAEFISHCFNNSSQIVKTINSKIDEDTNTKTV